LIASLVFRRNLGSAEIPLITGITTPNTVNDWFTLLHSNPLLGMTLLGVFDIVNYVLVGLMFLALYVALRQTNRSYTLIALTLSLMGVVIYVVSNSAFSMFSLSNQYATATTDVQKSTLLASGQAVLASGYNPAGAVYQSAGYYLSLLFVAVAGLIMSTVMLKSKIFHKAIGYIGIVASVFDFAFLIGLLFVPQGEVYLLGSICLASAGLLLMVWHLLVGLKLYKLSRTSKEISSLN
jgi:hypothetical protein